VEEDKNAFMKKLLPLFLTLIFTTVFSQEYHFDYYIRYRHELKKNNKERPEIMDLQYIVNSQDHSYRIFFIPVNRNRLTASIIDFKNNLQHYFDIRNTKFPLKESDFDYKYSMRMPFVKKQFEEESKRRFFNSELLKKQNDGLVNYSIKEFTNEKMKNPRASAEVVFADFKDDLSFVGLQLLFDYYEIDKKVKFSSNYILKSASKKFEDLEINLSLDAIEPQDFTINISQSQLKFKNN